MLNTPAPFPHPGSIGFRLHTAEPARVIRANADGTLLVERRRRLSDGTTVPIAGASANVAIPRADLFADPLDAAHGGKPTPRRRRARKQEMVL